MAGRLVVLGLGYVGLPLAQAAARAGWRVHGFDVSNRVVQSLNAGASHVDDLSDADVAEMLELGFRASTDPGVVADADVAVICVPTPLGDGGAPDLDAIAAAAPLFFETRGVSRAPGVVRQ